jgi:hypothetical protein
MGELIKIASNGQWTLEKAVRRTTQELIDEFLANKANTKAAPAASKRSMEGLRPVANTAGVNPKYTKEQVAAIRAGIPAEQAAALSTSKPSPQEKHVASTQSKLQNEQSEDDAKAKTGQNRKAAWEATAKFLAQHGGEKKEAFRPEAMGAGYGYGTATGGENKGWNNIYQNLQTKKMLDEAANSGNLEKPKRQLMPPQEMIRDQNGRPQMVPRQGRFHGDGAQTRGKIVNKQISFPLPGQEGVPQDQIRYGRSNQPLQEVHHWGWDHGKKQWNHIKTVLGSTKNG